MRCPRDSDSGHNRYAYALANPWTLVDPDGHMALKCGGDDCSGAPFPEVIYEDWDTTVEYMASEMVTNASRPEYERTRDEDWLRTLDLMPDAGGSSGWLASVWTAFALNVSPGGEWDHKDYLKRTLGLEHGPGPEDHDFYIPVRGSAEWKLYYDVWSNIHYAYVGRAAGMSPDIVRWGHEQFSAGASDAVDELSVEIGLQLWDAYGLDLEASDLAWAVFSHLDEYVALELSDSELTSVRPLSIP